MSTWKSPKSPCLYLSKDLHCICLIHSMFSLSECFITVCQLLFESTVGSCTVYEITVLVGFYTTATTTRAGSAIVNSHILKMITFVISLVPMHKSLGTRVICDLHVNSTSSVTVITCASATVNSHILRMETVFISKWVSWAGGQPWFCTNTIDIVQPGSSSSRPKPAEQNTQYYGYVSPHLLGWKWHHIALYPGSFSQESKWAWV